jgi:hypothetical protein
MVDTLYTALSAVLAVNFLAVVLAIAHAMNIE